MCLFRKEHSPIDEIFVCITFCYRHKQCLCVELLKNTNMMRALPLSHASCCNAQSFYRFDGKMWNSCCQLISNYYYYFIQIRWLHHFCVKFRRKENGYLFAESWFIRRKNSKKRKNCCWIEVLTGFRLPSIELLICWLTYCCYGNQMDWCQLFTFKFISLQCILVHLFNADNI